MQETFPTGQYDRLGNRPADGLGSGAYTTTVAFFSQMYFWLPNGRILRMRLNALQAFSSAVNLKGLSVYGTGTGFSGHAAPGSFFFVDASWEYSVTRHWVLAITFQGSRRWKSWVRRSGEPFIFGFAPATLGETLSAYGFLLQSDLSTAEAAHRYRASIGRNEAGSELYRVTSAIRAGE